MNDDGSIVPEFPGVSSDKPRFRVRMPSKSELHLGQDEEYCLLTSDGVERRVRFHDYHEIYQHQGLYEHLIYEQLQCASPRVVRDLLGEQLRLAGKQPEQLRVLDLGAGNGIVAEELRSLGTRHIVGADIIAEAADAARRDRPGIYADYLVADIARLTAAENQQMIDHQFTALTCVGALGFGDIPAAAFAAAFNYVAVGGWIALTIKDRFLEESDPAGIGGLIKRCTETGILQIRESTRYRHRFSVAGEPLYYTAMIATKHRDITEADQA